jgi:hypothetical protein
MNENLIEKKELGYGAKIPLSETSFGYLTSASTVSSANFRKHLFVTALSTCLLLFVCFFTFLISLS